MKLSAQTCSLFPKTSCSRKPKSQPGDAPQPFEQCLTTLNVAGHGVISWNMPHDVLGDERFDGL